MRRLLLCNSRQIYVFHSSKLLFRNSGLKCGRKKDMRFKYLSYVKTPRQRRGREYKKKKKKFARILQYIRRVFSFFNFKTKKNEEKNFHHFFSFCNMAKDPKKLHFVFLRIRISFSRPFFPTEKGVKKKVF